MNNTSYSFAALRYIHDSVTQEFITVGIVLYAPKAQFLQARCSPHYGRISRTFGKLDGGRLVKLTSGIQRSIEKLGEQLVQCALPFDASLRKFEDLLACALPHDDSALQFARLGVGVTDDPQNALDDLYERYVNRYSERAERHARNDEEVWRVYRAQLDRQSLTPRFSEKTISAPDLEYRFSHAVKNGRWHAFEPVSLDLLEADSIIDKALRWQARLENLHESREPFQVALLLGSPSEDSLREAFERARRILGKAAKLTRDGLPIVELVTEGQAAEFADRVKRLLDSH